MSMILELLLRHVWYQFHIKKKPPKPKIFYFKIIKMKQLHFNIYHFCLLLVGRWVINLDSLF